MPRSLTMPKCVHRSEVTTEWRDLPVRVEYQVEKFDDGTEFHVYKIPHFGRTFGGTTQNEALATLFNCHPLR